MKRLFIVLFITITVFALQSCNEKNETDPEPQNTIVEYFPLKVGNYWVYERSSCDSSWSDCNSISIDTNWITKDTLIKNMIYYKVEGKNVVGINSPYFLRDSSDYIISPSGNIFLSNKDFDKKLYERYEINPSSNDTIFYMYYQFKNKPNIIEVPAGIYDCIDFQGSLFRQQDNYELEFNYHHYFAKDVGPVYQNVLYANSLGGIKRELVSYNIDTE